MNHLLSKQTREATDHEVGDTGEHHGGKGPQCEDVRQDLRQEVDRQPVVAADVLMTDEKQKIQKRNVNIGGKNNQKRPKVMKYCF